MTDSTNRDERRLLASAYLDDELTQEERAHADADPAVLAEVEAMRAVRAQLGAVEPPDAPRRDAAIAAALAAASPALEAPPRPSLDARRRARWLAPAAAVAAAVVLVVGGIAALRVSEDDDSGGVRQESAATVREAAGGGSATTTASASEAPAPAATTAAGAETTAGGGGGESTSAEETEASERDTQMDGDFAFATDIPLVIDAPELRALVERLTVDTAVENTTGADDSAVPTCDYGSFVTRAAYQPSPGGMPRIVEVFIAPSGSIVAAVTDTCEVVLEAVE